VFDRVLSSLILLHSLDTPLLYKFQIPGDGPLEKKN
jgi:hypothetical protein